MNAVIQTVLAEGKEMFPNTEILALFGDNLKIKISPLRDSRDNELPLLYHAINL